MILEENMQNYYRSLTFNMSLDQTKSLLQKTLSSVPNDFALNDVRFHLTHALQKLEHVEKKRINREKPSLHQQWRERINNNVINPLTGPDTLGAIDNMIENEQKKLKKKKEPDQTLFD